MTTQTETKKRRFRDDFILYTLTRSTTYDLRVSFVNKGLPDTPHHENAYHLAHDNALIVGADELAMWEKHPMIIPHFAVIPADKEGWIIVKEKVDCDLCPFFIGYCDPPSPPHYIHTRKEPTVWEDRDDAILALDEVNTYKNKQRSKMDPRRYRLIRVSRTPRAPQAACNLTW